MKTISSTDARRQFGSIARAVSQGGEMFIVESRGDPVAAIVPIGVFKTMLQGRQAFYDHAEIVAERVDLSEEEAQRIISSAIERVRHQ